MRTSFTDMGPIIAGANGRPGAGMVPSGPRVRRRSWRIFPLAPGAAGVNFQSRNGISSPGNGTRSAISGTGSSIMPRRASSVILALAVLLATLAWPAADVAAATAASHRCCRRVQGSTAGCRTQAISCCPSPQRGHDTTPPPAATSSGTTTLQLDHAGLSLPGAALIAAKTVAAEARSFATLKSRPDPLYLKHLTLLV